jgi:hypothetical protein
MNRQAIREAAEILIIVLMLLAVAATGVLLRS